MLINQNLHHTFIYRILIPFTISLLIGAQAFAEIEFYVSPTGSDENSGSIEKPFLSIERARDEIRLLRKQKVLETDVVVNLRGGIHRMNKTLVLGLKDSAPKGRRITYRGYANEEAIISSGVKVTDWKKVSRKLPGLPATSQGKIWMADIPEGLGLFYTLYDSDTRLPRARTQGFVPDTDIHIRKNRDDSLDNYTLHYPKGAVKLWSNLEDVELLILPSWPWTMNILPLASIDEKRHIVRTTIPGTYQLCDMVHYARGNKGYETTAWIENVFEGLDSPGEWVVNTRERKIYLWPTGSAPSDTIEVPVLRELIRVEGTNDQVGDTDIPVRGIHFSKLSFTIADRGTWTLSDRGIQHDWEMLDKDNAMLRFRGASDCLVEKCRFSNAGGNAIRMDLYAQRIKVQNCLFEHLGQSAVVMLGYGPGIKDVNKHNELINNYVHHCGEIYWHSQMFIAWQSGNNRIAHNYFHNIPRKAICISGVRSHWVRKDKKIRQCASTIRWHEIGNPKNYQELVPFLHARNNIVELNEIHDALQMLGDGSAINLSGGSEGNIVRLNYIHDIDSLNPSSAIRMDGNQNDVLVEDNIIVNISVSGISAKGVNTVRNNFLINVNQRKKTYGVIRGLGREEGLSHIENNIFYNPSGKKTFYGYTDLEKYEDALFDRIDHNIYFNPEFPSAERSSVDELKQKGADKNSIDTDPLFKDWKNGDFTLLPDSPALKTGIKQIDITQAGLTDEFPPHWRK